MTTIELINKTIVVKEDYDKITSKIKTLFIFPGEGNFIEVNHLEMHPADKTVEVKKSINISNIISYY